MTDRSITGQLPSDRKASLIILRACGDLYLCYLSYLPRPRPLLYPLASEFQHRFSGKCTENVCFFYFTLILHMLLDNIPFSRHITFFLRKDKHCFV